MTIEKRLKMLTFALVTFTCAEIFLALIALLENSTPGHVALIYGSQLVLIDGMILSSRKRLKRERQAQSPVSNPQERGGDTDRKVRVRLYLYILVNVSIPLWTLYLASQFTLHLKIVIAIVSAIFMNLTLFFSFRNQERKMRSTS